MIDRSIIVFIIFVSLGCHPGCDRQQAFPDRPITLLCPWSAGGGTDRVARQLGFVLEQELGVPVNVVNATGGGGVTGHTRGAVSRPDGYTLTIVTVELNMLHWRSLTNITYRDYEPVAMVNQDAAAIFVRSDSEWQTLADLAEAIRSNPGKLKASGTAFAGIWHVGLAGWLSRVDINPSDVVWIAMGGSAPSLQELMAGALDIVACSLPEGQILLNAGKLRCLGVMTDARLPSFPDVPTFRELGVDWQISAYRGIMVPVGVPQDRLRILEAAVLKAARSDVYLEFLDRTGAGAAALPSVQFRAFLAKTDAEFGSIMKSKAFADVTRKYDAMFFPKILLSMFSVLAITFMLSGGLRRAELVADISRPVVMDIAVVVGGISFYLLAAEVVGFVVTAMVLLMIVFVRLRVRLPVALAVTVILVPMVYHLFAIYLRVPLPRGWFAW
jgi:tripartite-type tricarboxylate transporter receptor subunit TctC